MTVTCRKNSNAEQVYNSVVEKIRMSKNTALYFYLFEIVEYNFGKLLEIHYFNFITVLQCEEAMKMVVFLYQILLVLDMIGPNS